MEVTTPALHQAPIYCWVDGGLGCWMYPKNGVHLTLMNVEVLSDSLGREFRTLRDFLGSERREVKYKRQCSTQARRAPEHIKNRRALTKGGLKVSYTNFRSPSNKIDVLKGKVFFRKF